MSKNKAITLFSIICVVLAALLAMTFARFSIGTSKYNSVIGAINFDYDLAGGSAYLLEFQDDNVESVNDDNVNEMLNVMSNRMKELGYKNYSLTALKNTETGIMDYDVLLQAKDNGSLSSDLNVVIAYGKIEFYGKDGDNAETQLLKDINAVKDCRFAGRYTTAEGKLAYQVSLTFTDEAAAELVKAIGTSTNYNLSIKLGDTNIMSGTVDADTIRAKTLSLSAGSENSAKQLALEIRTGGLAYKYSVSEDSPYSVSALLGKDALLIAVIVLGAVIVAMCVALCVLFKGYGIVGCLSLLTFVVLELGMMIAVPGITVSASGLIGMLGATVLMGDGLIIAIKRISEEYGSGKTVKAAVKTGYKRAFFPTLGISLFSGIAGLILFFLTGGAVNSFAITLGIGAVCAFLCNALVSRALTSLLIPMTGKPEEFFNLKRADE